jgi:hypothetical protein
MIEHGKLPKNMALNSIVGFGIFQSAAQDALPRMTPRRQLQIRTPPFLWRLRHNTALMQRIVARWLIHQFRVRIPLAPARQLGDTAPNTRKKARQQERTSAVIKYRD